MNNRLRKLIIIGIYFILVMFVVVHFVFYFINKVAVVSFKKLHSAYSQALEITVDDMLGDTGCYFSSSKKIKSDFYLRIIAHYMNCGHTLEEFETMSTEKFNFYVASYIVEMEEDIDKSLTLAKISNPLFSLYGGGKQKGKKMVLSNKQ